MILLFVSICSYSWCKIWVIWNMKIILSYLKPFITLYYRNGLLSILRDVCNYSYWWYLTSWYHTWRLYYTHWWYLTRGYFTWSFRNLIYDLNFFFIWSLRNLFYDLTILWDLWNRSYYLNIHFIKRSLVYILLKFI